MHAAWYLKNGEALDVLQVGELPTPEPGPGEVRVKVKVSGVNPSDVKSRRGRPVTSGLIVPHSDGAGVIDKVGAGVSGTRVGERVWIWNGQWQRPMGTAAQYIVLPLGQAVHLPDNTDFDAGACFGIPALTAFQAIQFAGELRGKTALVIGASSCVGYYAAQLARLKGARVIGTVGSAEKAAYVQSIGVADTINYKVEPVAERIRQLTDGRGVDVVIDMDFSTTEKLVEKGAIAQHGRIVCYGSNLGEVPISFRAWLYHSISLHFFLVYDLLANDRRFAIEQLTALLSQDQLTHNIGKRFTLDEIVQAHIAVESGKTLGNVILSLIPIAKM
ncbi:MAG: NADPH:quinone reductase [Burkholderiaceae bacterium]